MRLASLVLAGLLTASSSVAAERLASLEYLGLATIPHGETFADTVVGGLSGITYDPQLDRYYAISDDPSYIGPARFYTLRIDLDRAPRVEIQGVTILTDRKGRPFGERVIDGEGIVLTPRRTLVISSEGNIERGIAPSIREHDLDGREIHQYRISKRYQARKREPWGVRHNVAFEALALTPDGRAFLTATENALHQDGPSADVGQSSPVRISRFDLESGKLEADFVYVVDPVVSPPSTPDGFRTNGLVELLALDGDTLLALERSFSLGVGNSIRLYLASTAGADDVRRTRRLARRRDVEAAAKRLLIDLADLDLIPDNVEGMTLGPRLADGRRALILVSDDNFNSRQTTQLLAFAVDGDQTPPSTIQGRAHRSPLEGRWLAETRGVVTAVRDDERRPGFWIQAADTDDDDATSDGLFVSMPEPPVAVGDLVAVGGRVVESGRPGELPVTGLAATHVEVLRRAVPLPPPVLLGADRRVPAIVDDDGLTRFDPESDAIDFFESLEGTRIEVETATATGPTTRFGTLTLATAYGDAPRTARNGLLIADDAVHTGRLTIDGSVIGGLPDIEVGQRLASPLTGVLDYAFGGYRLMATAAVSFAPLDGPRAVAPAEPLAGDLSVLTYNVWNLDPGDPEERFATLGRQIAARSPALVALQEIQDDNGTEDDGTVGAAATLGKLVAAISGHGGPAYQPLQLDPENNADGGAPGGNIRVAFLYDPARMRLAEGDSKLGERNPLRLFASSAAFRADEETGFRGTRKPLAAEFELQGRRLVAVNVHLKSKGGDDPPFGATQPPLRHTERQRLAQAEELGAWAAALLADDRSALLVVLGDFNEFEFRAPMRRLADHGLINLVERVEAPQRYTFNFGGGSQAIDYILVSPALAERARKIEILHLNADFPHARRASDHDPVSASFDLPIN